MSSESPSPRGRSPRRGVAAATASRSRSPDSQPAASDEHTGAAADASALAADDLRHALQKRRGEDTGDAENASPDRAVVADGPQQDLRELLDWKQVDGDEPPPDGEEAQPALPASSKRKGIRSMVTSVTANDDAGDAPGPSRRGDRRDRHRDAGGRYDRSGRGGADGDGKGGDIRGQRQDAQHDDRRGRGAGGRYDRSGGERGRGGDERGGVGGARGEKRPRVDGRADRREAAGEFDASGNGRADADDAGAKAARRDGAGDGAAGSAPSADLAGAVVAGAASKKKDVLPGRGGVYIPPFRLKQMMAEAAEDKQSEQYQRMMWEVRLPSPFVAPALVSFCAVRCRWFASRAA